MLAMVAKLYAGALEESPDVPHVGWRVGAYVGRSCAVMPPLAFGASDVPDLAALADAAPYVDDPAMRCFASRLRRREPLHIAVFGTSVVAGNRCNKQNGANFPQILMQLLDRRFPGGNLTLSTFGYPGASPTFLRACSDTLLPTQNADLYIIEMMDNLSGDYTGFGREVRCSPLKLAQSLILTQTTQALTQTLTQALILTLPPTLAQTSTQTPTLTLTLTLTLTPSLQPQP
jgi:hypothetical protein